MGAEFQFCKMKEFRRWVVVMAYSSVNVLSAIECTLRKVKMVNFMVC